MQAKLINNEWHINMDTCVHKNPSTQFMTQKIWFESWRRSIKWVNGKSLLNSILRAYKIVIYTNQHPCGSILGDTIDSFDAKNMKI